MNNFGYIKVASAIPSVKVGDVTFNLQQAEEIIAKAEGKGVEIIVFPELSLTGYTCQDLFRQQILIDAAEQAVMMLLDFTRQLDIIAIVGLPVMAATYFSTVRRSFRRGISSDLSLRHICQTILSSMRSDGSLLLRT